MIILFHTIMPATTYHTTVERIDVLSYNVRSFRLKLAQPFEFQAGQFVIINIPADLPGAPPDVRARAAQSGGGVVKRAYSIASPPHEANIVELCIQHVEHGIASTFFWQLKEGMPVSLSGPHGRFTLKEPLTYEPVFLATGTGVAPFRSMIKHLMHISFTNQMWLLFGCRYEHGLLYEGEFRAIASLRRNLRYIPTVSRPKEWLGETGHIQQTFLKHITDVSNKEIYLCGWSEVVKSVMTDLTAAGIPSARLHYEEWA